MIIFLSVDQMVINFNNLVKCLSENSYLVKLKRFLLFVKLFFLIEV